MKRLFMGAMAVLLLFSGFMAYAPRASAAAPTEGFNIITSPLPIKLITKPGQTVETELRMKNQGTQPEGIKVGLMKFGATGESGEPDLFDLSSKDTYASWIHFSPSYFVAQPNVWNTVKMTINVPKDAGLGYYLAVTFSRASQPGEPQSTSLKGAVATLVLLNVDNGNEQRQLQLNTFTATHGLYEYLPANFTVRLRNNGNIYLAPTGNVFIERGGKTVDVLNFNTAGGSVLPQSNRTFTLPWTDGFPVYKDKLVNGKPDTDKKGHTKQSLKWDFTHVNKFRIGHYTARLLVVYDNGKQDVPLESTLSFWVIPWKIILVLLLILALIGFGVYTLLRSVFGKTKGKIEKRRSAKK